MDVKEEEVDIVDDIKKDGSSIVHKKKDEGVVDLKIAEDSINTKKEDNDDVPVDLKKKRILLWMMTRT